MAVGDRKDPVRGFNFRVEIDGIGQIAFREVSGLDPSTDPVDYREGDEKRLSVRKLTGLRKYTVITMKRGIAENSSLWNWYQEIQNGAVKRKNGSVTLLDEEQNDVLRWNFYDGWISKWQGPSMNATSNDVAIEAIEICHERLELA